MLKVFGRDGGSPFGATHRAVINAGFILVAGELAVLAERKYPSVAYEIAEKISEDFTGDVRVAIPGHTQRGGAPGAYDRIISSRFGAKAAELIKDEDYGKLVVYKNGQIDAIPLAETAGKLKYVDPECQLIQEAKTLGISFGD